MKNKYYPISTINVICASRYKFQVNERRKENNMNINGEIRVFVKDFKTDKGENVKLFNTSLSNKTLSGEYQHASLNVMFNKKNYTAEQLNKFDSNKMYVLDVEDGFLTFTTATEEKKFIVYINKATIKEVKEIKAKSQNDLPF